MPEIHCLMVSGLSLDNPLRTFLFKTACEMAKNGNVRKNFRNTKSEGTMTTEYATANLAGLHGVIFEANIETNTKKGGVRFIVRPVDVSRYNEENFVWSEVKLSR